MKVELSLGLPGLWVKVDDGRFGAYLTHSFDPPLNSVIVDDALIYTDLERKPFAIKFISTNTSFVRDDVHDMVLNKFKSRVQ